MANQKNDKMVKFGLVLGVLIVNVLLYKWFEFAGALFFLFYGMWVLGYALYQIAKLFKPDL